MACSIDHTKLGGLKFCTECGAPAEKGVRLCTQGHELVRTNKFCETCGSPEAGGDSAPAPRVTPPLERSVPRVAPAQPTFSPLSSPAPSSPLLPPPPAFNDLPAYVPKKKNTAAIIGASVTAAVLAIVLVVVNANKVTYTDVTVSMSIYDQSCWNLSWGYFDIPGGEVYISVDGERVAYGSYPAIGTQSGLSCKFETTLYNVPMNGETYLTGMSSGRRGTISKSKSEMESDGWVFDLYMGY